MRPHQLRHTRRGPRIAVVLTMREGSGRRPLIIGAHNLRLLRPAHCGLKAHAIRRVLPDVMTREALNARSLNLTLNTRLEMRLDERLAIAEHAATSLPARLFLLGSLEDRGRRWALLAGSCLVRRLRRLDASSKLK